MYEQVETVQVLSNLLESRAPGMSLPRQFYVDPGLFEEDLEPQLRPHGLERAKVTMRHHYEVMANWKILIENNRECYHCRVSHPEFCMSNYDLGLPGDTRSDDGYDTTLQREYERWRDLGLAPEEVSYPGGAPYRVSR